MFLAFHLFGNYNKPGPGVEKDEPQKAPFIRFWQLFFRKFFNLIKLNMLFLIPVVAIFALIYFITMFTTNSLICSIPLILLSPFVAGITFVTRNYTREEHAFIFSDFKDAVKNNWKQFLLNGIIVYVIGNVVAFCANFYYSLTSKGALYTIPFGITVAIMMIFLFAQYYIPMMIVTFELTTKQLYKNALIFAIVGLWRNILMTAIFAVVLFLNYFLFLVYTPIVILVDGLFIILLLFSFTSFLINFTIYPLIDKMMIRPFYAKQNGVPLEEEKTKEEVREEEEQKAVQEESEYVFVNGKLVKRSSMDEDDGPAI